MVFEYFFYISFIFIIHLLTYFIGNILNIVDKPTAKRKIHKGSIVCLGGMAIFLSYFLMIFLLDFSKEINNIFIFGCYISILGLIDDKFSIDPFIRIFMQIAIIAYFLYSTNLYLETIIISKNLIISLGALKELITIVTIVFIINSFNYLDGVDGLCSILFMSIIGAILILTNEYILVIYTLTPVIIFTFFNFKFYKLPKLFLGDNGSTLLGFLVASFSIYFSKYNDLQLKIPDTMVIWILAFVSFEFLSTSLSRVIRKKGLFTPGHDHIHYLLLDKFKSKYLVIFFIISLNFFFILVGNLINKYNSNYSFILFIIFFIVYFYTRENFFKHKLNKEN